MFAQITLSYRFVFDKFELRSLSKSQTSTIFVLFIFGDRINRHVISKLMSAKEISYTGVHTAEHNPHTVRRERKNPKNPPKFYVGPLAIHTVRTNSCAAESAFDPFVITYLIMHKYNAVAGMLGISAFILNIYGISTTYFSTFTLGSSRYFRMNVASCFFAVKIYRVTKFSRVCCEDLHRVISITLRDSGIGGSIVSCMRHMTRATAQMQMSTRGCAHRLRCVVEPSFLVIKTSFIGGPIRKVARSILMTGASMPFEKNLPNCVV